MSAEEWLEGVQDCQSQVQVISHLLSKSVYLMGSPLLACRSDCKRRFLARQHDSQPACLSFTATLSSLCLYGTCLLTPVSDLPTSCTIWPTPKAPVPTNTAASPLATTLTSAPGSPPWVSKQCPYWASATVKRISARTACVECHAATVDSLQRGAAHGTVTGAAVWGGPV